MSTFFLIIFTFNESIYFDLFIIYSVADPLHFNADPDPDPRIRFRDNGSGSSYGSGSDLNSSKFQFFPSSFFSVKGIKLITMLFFFVILSLLFTYIKKK